MRNFSIVFLFISFIGCFYQGEDRMQTSTMKYISENNEVIFLKCESEFENNLRNGVNKCYEENGKLFLEEVFENGKRNGKHVEFFSNGKIKVKEYYINDTVQGESLVFHSNGHLKYYRYVKDGIVIYEKERDSLGQLLASRLPVTVKKKNKEKFIVDKPDTISIKLGYSQFDSVQIIGLLDVNADDQYDDTVYVKNNFFDYVLIPQKEGTNLLKGVLVEVDGHKMIESGEGIINFEYQAELPSTLRSKE